MNRYFKGKLQYYDIDTHTWIDVPTIKEPPLCLSRCAECGQIIGVKERTLDIKHKLGVE